MDSLVVVLVILIILSGYFSATETAFSCINRVRVTSWCNSGENKRAEMVLKIVGNYDKFITTVLIGNNIVNILSTIIATIIFASVWADPSMSATMTTVIMTLTVLTFGEVIPKSLAKRFPEKFAMFTAPIIKFFGYLFYPLSFCFFMLQKLIEKIFKTEQDSVTNEELLTIIDEAESSGGIDKDNGELIRSAVEFDEVVVGKITTPRVDIVAVEKNFSMEQIFQTFKKSGFSRLPVYDKTIDNIVGFIHEKRFFFAMHDNKADIAEIIQPIKYTQSQVKIDDLLKDLQRSATHMCVVLDEFGGTQGIVTLEDCIEELVGEIYDESDVPEKLYVKDENGAYVFDGSAELEDFFALFNLEGRENEFEAHSVGGWICEYLELLPNEGLSFEYENLIIEVTNVNRHRITTVTVKVTE